MESDKKEKEKNEVKQLRTIVQLLSFVSMF